MRRSKNNNKKQENNLFNYFTKTKASETKKESMSSIIAKTTIVSSRSIPTKQPSNKTKSQATLGSIKTSEKVEQTIDLTADDDDIEMLLSTPVPEESVSVFSSQSSFGSQQRERPQYEEITNTSKYNRKGWSAQAKERGPIPSSLIATPQDKTERYERIVLKKARVTAKPTYDWLGPNDVKPFSSNYNDKSKVASEMYIRKPDISLQNYNGKRERDDNVSYSFDGSWDSQGFSSQKSSSSSQRSTSKGWNGDSIPSASSLNKSKSGFENSFGSSSSSTQSGSTFWNAVANKRNESSEKYSNVKMEKFASSQGYGSLNKEAKSEYRPELSEEQQRVLNMVVTGKKSLFFTGSAGTGKSVLLRAIIDTLGQRYGSGLAVTASTGIAACNINGSTLHSFGGIGIAKDSAQNLAQSIKYNNRKAKDRWINTKVLIIDEISMVDADLFDKLEYIARDIRQSTKPFGGIQIIVTGDFFQLPPVNPNQASKFAFEAKSWPLAITQTVMLSKVFRQKDGTFIRILNEMRLGHLSQEAIEKFKSLERAPENHNDIEPTELYPLRNEVDISNKRRLDALKGDVVEYAAIDSGDPRKMQSCIAPQLIQLKMHAQVMLLKNIDLELVNGSLGVVVGFVGQGIYRKKKTVEQLRTPHRQKDSYIDANGEIDMSVPYPVVKFASGRTLVLEPETWSVELPGGRDSASRQQLPLMLAWAISIHKSQGQTLDRVKVDLGKVFEKGQAYVALSRATSLESLQILNFDPARVMAHPTVTRFYQSLQTV